MCDGIQLKVYEGRERQTLRCGIYAWVFPFQGQVLQDKQRGVGENQRENVGGKYIAEEVSFLACVFLCADIQFSVVMAFILKMCKE